MSAFSSDRNLLVGVLGLQMGLISESMLITALQSWIFHKDHPLEDILLRQNALKPESFVFLRNLAEQHMRLHSDDAAASLAALSTLEMIQFRIAELEDENLAHTITRISGLKSRSTETRKPGDSPNELMQPMSPVGRFRIIRPHARGGLGQISIAEDLELRREVALKEIQPQFVRDRDSRTRFLIEAEITGRLEHPGIVPVYSLGNNASGDPFYVMRFIEGDSLKEAIHQFHQSTTAVSADDFGRQLKRLVRRLVDVCNTIHYAHSRGVLHRDLKPGNIMLGKYGETLVVDWGLARTGTRTTAARSADDATFVPLSSDISSETRMGSVVGTLAYMSPEQAEGKLDELGPASDVYSLGATLHCILTGHQPVPRQDPAVMLRIVREGQIPAPRSFDKRIPEALEAICRKAMSRNSSARYASARDLAQELELWLADEPVSAFREPAVERALRFARRHRTAVTTAAGVLMTTVLSLLILTAQEKVQNARLKSARDLAVANMQQSQTLAITLLTAAENKLSDAPVNKASAYLLRRELTEKAFTTFSAIYSQNPDSRSVEQDLARTARIASNLHRMSRTFDLANEEIQLSLNLQHKIPPADRTAAQTELLAATYRDLATLHNAQGKLSDAAAALKVARDLMTPLISRPDASDAQKLVAAGIHVEELALQQELLSPLKAKESLAAALDVYRPLLQRNNLSRADREVYRLLRAREIFLLKEYGDTDKAIEIGRTLLPESRAWAEAAPQDDSVRLARGRNLYWLAESLLIRGDEPAEAGILLEDCLQVLNPLRSSENSSARAALADALRVHALYCIKVSEFQKSQDSLSAALEVMHELTATTATPDHLELTARIWIASAELATAQQKPDDARNAWQTARQQLELACQLSPDSKAKRQRLEKLPLP